MRTVVDTSALIALLYPDDHHNKAASDALGQAHSKGSLVVNDITYAELSADPYFQDNHALDTFLDDTGVTVESPSQQSLFKAGKVFQTYLDNRGQHLQCPECGHETTFECPECGNTLEARQHIPADFLIGAHAELEADRLLTFDEGFYTTYFEVDVEGVKG